MSLHHWQIAPGEIDFFIVRENTEGEYSSIGGKMFPDTDREFVIQESVFTRHGVDRVLKYAFELAMKREARHLTAATKSNGISITMPYWDERVEAMAAQYPDISWDKYHIDILTAHFVLNPDKFDVVVASNLFGDILSDLGPACTGTIGIAPSGNINPEKVFPSLFEPVHGSAPDITGKGIANPVGQIWTGAMMLDHLGYAEAGATIVSAIETCLADQSRRTPDLKGDADTTAAAAAIADCLRHLWEDTMEQRELGTSGIMVSAFCLGSMTWGTQNTEAEGHAQIDMALDHGINFIDTAEISDQSAVKGNPG